MSYNPKNGIRAKGHLMVAGCIILVSFVSCSHFSSQGKGGGVVGFLIFMAGWALALWVLFMGWYTTRKIGKESDPSDMNQGEES